MQMLTSVAFGCLLSLGIDTIAAGKWNSIARAKVLKRGANSNFYDNEILIGFSEAGDGLQRRI